MNQTLCAFLCGESQKNAVGGEYDSPAKKREILPQTEKWFVGDDACIVPNDGLYRIYYHIIPRTTVGAQCVPLRVGYALNNDSTL